MHLLFNHNFFRDPLFYLFINNKGFIYRRPKYGIFNLKPISNLEEFKNRLCMIEVVVAIDTNSRWSLIYMLNMKLSFLKKYFSLTFYFVAFRRFLF